MALIRCFECKSEVSDKATTCPKCGAPVTISEKKEKRQTSAGRGCLITLLIAGGIIAAIVASNQSDGPNASAEKHLPTQPAEPTSKDLIEYQLAVVNKGGYVREDDVTVTRFRYLLDQIQSKTGHSYQEIADMTVRAQNILRNEYGRTVNLLELMEESWKTLSLDSGATYKDILAAIIMIMAN